MSSESYSRGEVIKALKPHGLDPHSVENLVETGTPDVNFADGWIELKRLERWPVRGGPVLIDHFTPQQRIWLRRRWAAYGAAFLLLHVGREWVLFDGQTAADFVGFAPWTEHDLKAKARARFATTAEMREELYRCLSRQIS